MSWDKLSMAEKAEIMKLAVQGGVYNLDAIRNGYNEYAKGGKIHIKPENRGKFTALKKRTGHSATWFKEHGTPAQRKMATFALNARKWKHENGGVISPYDQPQTFAGRVAQVTGVSPEVVRGADVVSSVAQMTPYGHFIGAMDLGRDLNRVYHGEEGAWWDSMIDAASMLPFLRQSGLKAEKTLYNTVRNNKTARRIINGAIGAGKAGDFISDTWGANKSSKAFGGNLYWPGGFLGLMPAMPGFLFSSKTIKDKANEALDNIKMETSARIMNAARKNHGKNNVSDKMKYDPSDPATANGGVAQSTYLLDRDLQRKAFLNAGYQEGSEGDYGLVRKAVGDRKLPVFQRKPDVISRQKLVPFGNAHLDYSDGKYRYQGPEDTELIHAGNYPMAYYVDNEGKMYTKAWDLNDYGDASSSGRYSGIKQVLANALDYVGNPTVVTTGFQPVVDASGNHLSAYPKGFGVINDTQLTPEQRLYNKFIKDRGLHLETIDGYGQAVPMLPEITITGKKKKKAFGGNIGLDLI